MTIGTALVFLITVVVIVLLLSALRRRRPRLVNRGRRPGGFRRRRIDAIKRAAARDIALIQGNDQVLRAKAAGDRESGL